MTDEYRVLHIRTESAEVYDRPVWGDFAEWVIGVGDDRFIWFDDLPTAQRVVALLNADDTQARKDTNV